MNVEKIKSGLYLTWNAIGGEIIESLGGESMSREEVIEVVLDANYLEMYGRLDKADLDAFRSLPFNEQDRIAAQVFTYHSYGM